MWCSEYVLSVVPSLSMNDVTDDLAVCIKHSSFWELKESQNLARDANYNFPFSFPSLSRGWLCSPVVDEFLPTLIFTTFRVLPLESIDLFISVKPSKIHRGRIRTSKVGPSNDAQHSLTFLSLPLPSLTLFYNRNAVVNMKKFLGKKGSRTEQPSSGQSHLPLDFGGPVLPLGALSPTGLREY
jgi:hypothetical protein